MRRLSFAIVAWLLFVLAPWPALAQGRGLALGQLRGRGGSTQPTTPVAGTGVRSFGVWLDDATVATPGSGWVSVSLGHSRSELFRSTDVPVIDGGYGLTDRVHLGASVPFYRGSDPAGTGYSGMGDVYLSAKVGLIDPAASRRRFGVAVVPVLEILADAASSPDGSRWQWALPISVEVPCERFRMYGAAGYFSRGALFASAAIDVPLAARLVAFGALTHTVATRADPLSDALGLNRQRVDISGGASHTIARTIGVFGSLGRTISRHDPTSTTLSVSTGVSVGFQR